MNSQTKSTILKKPDLLGATASMLCAVHCLAAPFIFLAQASFSTMHVEVPAWYQMIDYIFLVVSFFAIVHAIKNTAKNWMKTSLWTTWVVLTLAIINETFELMHLGEAAVYIPALTLVGLHLYNRKYCQCEEECCTNPA